MAEQVPKHVPSPADVIRPAPRVQDAQNFLLHKRMLGERLYYYSLARFAVAAAIAAASFAAAGVVGISGLQIPRLLMVAIVLGLYNVAVFIMVRPFRSSQRASGMHSLLVGVMHGAIMLDFVFLTVVIWLVGGARSPFLAFYLFNLILASVLLSRNAAFLHAAVAYFFLALLVVGEWQGWFPAQSPGGAVPSAARIEGRYVATLLTVYGILFALSSVMLTSLMQLLRSGEHELREAKIESERLADLRREFLHIALHDLKSPVVAVAQHLYNLAVYMHKDLSEQESRCLNRCHLRLREQLKFLHDIEILASLETEQFRSRISSVDLRDILPAVVDENGDLALARGATLKLEPLNGPLKVAGIARLLHEAVANLVTNAIKYTPQGAGKVVVRAIDGGGCVRIEVQDNGVGIDQKDMPLLFQEFVQLPRQREFDDSVSSGLGLSIVRRIAEHFGGSVAARSEPNKGSVFCINLPAADRVQAPPAAMTKAAP